VPQGNVRIRLTDLYRSRSDFADSATEVHDFNPEISHNPDEVFCTAPLQSDREEL
jgi:hypothetical protein